MSVSRTFGPVQRPGLERDLTELFQRVEVLERVKAAAATVRIVRGALQNDATILFGTGFSTSWDNNGGAPTNFNFYTVYFDTPFDNPPIADAIPNNDNYPNLEGRYEVSLVTRDPAYVVFRTDDVDDADAPAQDGGFDFWCIEAEV